MLEDFPAKAQRREEAKNLILREPQTMVKTC